MWRALSVLLAVGAVGLVACSFSGGMGEGDDCGGQQDDCGKNLTCTPFQSGHSYCCPTPAWASKEGNCQGKQFDDSTPH
jgi:hypothetical protein